MTKTKEEKKMFVLDTNVLIMDPLAFRHMGEHDVVIPLVVITEVDKLKSKPTPAAVSARQVSANLDAYFCPDLYKDGVSLGEGKGKLSIYNLKKLHPEVQAMFVEDSPDNRIISVALYLTEKMKKAKKGKNADDSKVSVVFVTNDINLRFKAGALGINVEKYRNNTFQDVDSIYSGVKNITLSKELERKFKRSGGRLDYSLFEKNITAETNLVGGDDFKIITSLLSFAAAPSNNTKKLKFPIDLWTFVTYNNICVWQNVRVRIACTYLEH